jgi:AMP nucleosidase
LSRENTPPALVDGWVWPSLTASATAICAANYVERHIKIGIEALKLVRRRGRSVKHLRFEDDFDAGHET